MNEEERKEYRDLLRRIVSGAEGMLTAAGREKSKDWHVHAYIDADKLLRKYPDDGEASSE